jgi:hypothetical protein
MGVTALCALPAASVYDEICHALPPAPEHSSAINQAVIASHGDIDALFPIKQP